MSVPVSRDRLGTVTAYSYAVAGGYTGTEAEFQELLANVAIDLSEIENLSVIVTPLSEGSTPTASYDSGVLTLGIPKGDTGDSGVYIGETAPTNPNVDVWINPNGEGIEMVQDVTVGGNSVVTDGVAEIPVAGNNSLGLVQVGNGLELSSSGRITTSYAGSATIKAQTAYYNPITPHFQHEAVFYGLTKAAGVNMSTSSNPIGTYTENAKSAISTMLNDPETVTGTTPTITGKSGVRYICGEVATLSVTAPESGIIDVVFTSGTTPTVLTVTSAKTGVTAIKWANGFDPTSLDADTTYEINILDGEYGVACAWT